MRKLVTPRSFSLAPAIRPLKPAPITATSISMSSGSRSNSGSA